MTPTTHQKPQPTSHTETWRDRFDEKYGDRAPVIAFKTWEDCDSVKQFISDERTRVIDEVKKLVKGMRAMTITNPEHNHPADAYKLIDKNDLLAALEKLEEK